MIGGTEGVLTATHLGGYNGSPARRTGQYRAGIARRMMSYGLQVAAGEGFSILEDHEGDLRWDETMGPHRTRVTVSGDGFRG